MIWDKAKSILESSSLGIGLIVLGIFLVFIGGLSITLASKLGLNPKTGETFIEMGKTSFYFGLGVAVAQGYSKKKS